MNIQAKAIFSINYCVCASTIYVSAARCRPLEFFMGVGCIFRSEAPLPTDNVIDSPLRNADVHFCDAYTYTLFGHTIPYH